MANYYQRPKTHLVILLLLFTMSFLQSKEDIINLVKYNDEETLYNFIEKYPQEINITNNNGETALMYAVMNNNIPIVKYLISHNANVNATDEEGNTPLIIATKINSLTITKILVENKANINTLSDERVSALGCAIENDNKGIYQYLIKNGGNFFTTNYNFLNFNQIYPLLCKEDTFWLSELLKTNTLSLHNLLQLRYLLGLMDKKSQQTIVENEIKNKITTDKVDPFIQKIISHPYQTTENIFTKNEEIPSYSINEALLMAIGNNNMKDYVLLKDISNNSSLDTIIIQYLLDYNMFVFETFPTYREFTKNNITPLISHCLNNISLYDENTRRSLFAYICCCQLTDYYEILKNYNNNAKINIITTPLLNEKPAFYYIALGNNKDLFSYIFEFVGNDPNYQLDKEGNNLLIVSCLADNYDITKLLIEKGANVNYAENEKRTPLMVAVSKHNLKIIKLLVENGAAINATDVFKNTPLAYAGKSGYKEIEDYLIAHGAKKY